MIELQNLNNQSLEEILDDAKRQISYLSDEWTNHQEADPGITLVELFAWLKWVQHEYLNRVSPGVKKKFLKLLEIEPYKNKGSKALLQVADLEKDINIPKGTKWQAGNVVFENPKEHSLTNSEILSVLFENPDFSMVSEYYKFDRTRIFHLFGDKFRSVDKNVKRQFTINFDKPLSSKKEFGIYFEVYTGGKLKRNPVSQDDDFLEMAEVKWEYYGKENGELGWHEVVVNQDDTHSFLFSGVVNLTINGSMWANNGVYSLRCKLVSEEYDFPPKVLSILTNVFQVEQKSTMCENVTIKKKELSKNMSVKIKTHMAIYGQHIVYFKKGKSWVQTNNYRVERDVEKGNINLYVEEKNLNVSKYGEDEELVMLVSYDGSIARKMIFGSGTGTSAQFIEFRDKNVLYDGFEILVGKTVNNTEIFDKWRRVDDFFSSTKYDKDYVLDHTKEMITFGNHENGYAPRVGKDNIRLCRLEYCMGSNSDVKKGMINKVQTENTTLKKARINQVTSAVGGRDTETIAHAEARAAEVFADCGRAVTLEDYEKIINKTPGLLFKNVKVLPNYMVGENCNEQNCITVAVRWNDRIGQNLPISYEKNIMHQIDKYRLINTKVKVVCPEYIGLIISGEIVVNSFYRERDRLIEKSILSYINVVNMEMGKPLHFGDLFGMIDNLDYVSYTNKLYITPIGNYIEKTVSEDIIVPPNGIYYVKEINLNYLKSSEIYND